MNVLKETEITLCILRHLPFFLLADVRTDIVRNLRKDNDSMLCCCYCYTQVEE